MRLTDEQIDRALAIAWAEIDDDAADGEVTPADRVMQLVLDGLGEYEGSADQALKELVERDLIMGYQAKSSTAAMGSDRVSTRFDIVGVQLTGEGMARGKAAAAS